VGAKEVDDAMVTVISLRGSALAEQAASWLAEPLWRRSFSLRSLLKMVASPAEAELAYAVVAELWGRDDAWVKDPVVAEAELLSWLEQGIEVTDDHLELVFGPDWRPVAVIVDHASRITPRLAERLAAALAVWRGDRSVWLRAERGASWVSQWCGPEVRAAAGAARRLVADARRIDGDLIPRGTWKHALVAIEAALVATVSWDLAGGEPYALVARDALLGPYRDVLGLGLWAGVR
jgi:hypothetical protein